MCCIVQWFNKNDIHFQCLGNNDFYFIEKIKELMENTIDVSKDEMQLRGWVTKNDKLISDSVSRKMMF